MKKIINGKMYNTDTAISLGGWSNGYLYNDSYYCGEDLFRKRNGEFFLFREGGSLSQYAKHCGNDSCGTETIIPITCDAAREWAEKRLDADAYQKIFGDVAEDDGSMVIALSISAAAAEKVRRAAEAQGVTLSAYVDSLIQADITKGGE